MKNMNDIIVMKNGIAVLNDEFCTHMIAVKEQLKMLKEVDDANNEMFLEAMEKNGLIKFENDEIVVNYIAPTDRETFNTKKFKEDCPQVYDEYCTMKPVKASVRIKVK